MVDAVYDVVGGDTEVFGKLAAQTCAVKRCQSGNLRRLQAGIEQGYQAGNVGGVEHYHDMADVGAICAYILAELLGDGGVALEKILTCHACLTGGAT